MRWAGLPVALAGVVGYALAPVPDLLVTADGHHVAIRTPAGGIALLRDRAGDYVRDQFAEQSAFEGEMAAIADLPGTSCSPEFCSAEMLSRESDQPEGQHRYRILMARNRLTVPWRDLVSQCAAADIVIADRWLPKACHPRWLKLDRPDLASNGGAAITLADRSVRRSRNPRDQHPWTVTPRPRVSRRLPDQLYRRKSPASLPWMRTRPAS